jgi:hypothetical protein
MQNTELAGISQGVGKSFHKRLAAHNRKSAALSGTSGSCTKPDIRPCGWDASFCLKGSGEELYQIAARLLTRLGIGPDVHDAAFAVMSEGIVDLGRAVEPVKSMRRIGEDAERKVRCIGRREIAHERFASALAIVEIVRGADENSQRGVNHVHKLETGRMVVAEADRI